MKSIFNFLLILFFFSSACNSNQSGQTTAGESGIAQFEEFEIFRGTNIAHWLSQSSRRGEERREFFQKQDVDYLASLGFDHLRIPIDEEQMFDEEGNRHQEAFTLLDSAIHWCQQNQLRVIVDLHILRSHHFNEEEKPLWTDPAAQQRFIDLWSELSAALNKWPVGMVAYELMNEPVADDPAEWNQLVARATGAIRELEPERIIVIGSNRWQSVDTFDELELPDNDQNILLSYHFYEPFLLTHYQASWTGIADYDGPVNYPGQIVPENQMDQVADEWVERIQNRQRVYNRDTLEKMMQKPMCKAENTGLPLFCGEFGVVTEAPDEDRLQWYRDMIAIFEEHHIAYANWNYKSGNFGLVDENGNPNQELIDIVPGNVEPQ